MAEATTGLPDPLYDDNGRVRREVYQYLKTASPEQRREVVLLLIEQHPDPEGRLDLPQLDDGTSAHLSSLDLRPETLLAAYGERLKQEPTPKWWDVHLQGMKLYSAHLEGAHLWDAHLDSANLLAAHLDRAFLGEAHLEGADLSAANLRGATLSRAQLGGASLVGARLEGAKLWDAHLERARLTRARLSHADLTIANLAGAQLRGADLQGAILWLADLQEADLFAAHLESADFLAANLEGATLRQARLDRANLSRALLTGVHLAGACLERTRLRRAQLGEMITEELAARAKTPPQPLTRPQLYSRAALAYMALKQNFESLGDYDGASWAYRKERRMEKHAQWHRFHDACRKRNFGAASRALLQAAADHGVEGLCDYGESVWRVLAWLFTLFALSATAYSAFALGQLLLLWFAAGPQPLISLLSVLPVAAVRGVTASLASMVAMGAEGVRPEAPGLLRCLFDAVSAIQALLGIFLTGLLGFVAGNRIRRS